MTATTVEPVVETSTGDDEPDTMHISCHCSDNNTAWCGIDLTGVPLDDDAFDMDSRDSCVLCKLVIEQLEDKRCPWGCTCSPECGPSEQMRGQSITYMVIDEWQSRERK